MDLPIIWNNKSNAENRTVSVRWQVAPIGGFRCLVPEISNGAFAEMVLWWDNSFGGNPKRSNLQYLIIQPQFDINLPMDGLFILHQKSGQTTRPVNGSCRAVPRNWLQKFNAYLSQAASDYRKLADHLAKLGLSWPRSRLATLGEEA